jgi:quinol monooxygenase YgiN
MGRFAQQTRLVATPGNRDRLVAKFLEAAEIQCDNPDCELMLVSVSPDEEGVVYLTEVWASRETWERARDSDAIAAWSEGMPALVASSPETTPLAPIGGKGLANRRPEGESGAR